MQEIKRELDIANEDLVNVNENLNELREPVDRLKPDHVS